MKELKVDLARLKIGDQYTSGIFVRAKTPDGKWDSVDIVFLDGESLHAWLRSRGGDNPWAESTVGILLGHDVSKPPWSGGGE
jgi:hypothetical protein